MFDLSTFKLMCESIFCSDISIYYVPYILVLADRYRATELKSICQKFCAENYDGEISYLTTQIEFSV